MAEKCHKAPSFPNCVFGYVNVPLCRVKVDVDSSRRKVERVAILAYDHGQFVVVDKLNEAMQYLDDAVLAIEEALAISLPPLYGCKDSDLDDEVVTGD